MQYSYYEIYTNGALADRERISRDQEIVKHTPLFNIPKSRHDYARLALCINFGLMRLFVVLVT